MYVQLYNSAVTAWYEMNFKYYSEVLCENKDKPELECNGKCHLHKQLNVQENSENQTEPPTLMPEFQILADNFEAEIDQPFLSISSNTRNWHQCLAIQWPSLREIDHPPQV